MLSCELISCSCCLSFPHLCTQVIACILCQLIFAEQKRHRTIEKKPAYEEHLKYFSFFFNYLPYLFQYVINNPATLRLSSRVISFIATASATLSLLRVARSFCGQRCGWTASDGNMAWGYTG